MIHNTGLVIELQSACIGHRSITDVLRMAMMIAVKLDLPEERKWIESELNGYQSGLGLPPYRVVKGTVKALNPYHGLVPARFVDPEFEEMINDVFVGDSVAHLIQLTRDEGGEITYRFPSNIEGHLVKQQGIVAMQPYKVVGQSQVAGILGSIRNRVLDWALELEKNGVTGENMTFSAEEKEKAAQNIHITNNNVQGNMQGTVGQSGGTINQVNTMTIEAGSFDSLASYLRGHEIEEADIQSLEQSIVADGDVKDPKKFGSRVSTWMGNMMAKAASGAWGVGIGAAGNVLGSALTAFYGG